VLVSDQRLVRVILGCSLFYAMCDCFRLARFNTMLEQEPLPYWKHFFTGVPAPGGCWMVLTPAILSLALEAKGKYPALAHFLQNPWTGIFMLLFVGALMASRLPTISLKAIHLHGKTQVRIFMTVALLIIGLLVCDLWLTLGTLGLGYMLTVPITCAIFLKLRAKHERGLTSTLNKS
jgi:CDP-diacylglycerol--serine O-phosphatidyltransferase